LLSSPQTLVLFVFIALCVLFGSMIKVFDLVLRTDDGGDLIQTGKSVKKVG
jgi:hypothetical protein